MIMKFWTRCPGTHCSLSLPSLANYTFQISAYTDCLWIICITMPFLPLDICVLLHADYYYRGVHHHRETIYMSLSLLLEKRSVLKCVTFFVPSLASVLAYSDVSINRSWVNTWHYLNTLNIAIAITLESENCSQCSLHIYMHTYTHTIHKFCVYTHIYMYRAKILTTNKDLLTLFNISIGLKLKFFKLWH